jgi:tRNA threonylcarbamoyladenosine biosynthesis protein TsaB
MTVLGIETATSVCGAAITRDGTILAEASLDEKYVHAEKLLTLVHDVLQRTGTGLGTLDAIAVSIGPGSFTGLRIGLSVAKGLVYATGAPLVAVPTLQALAQRALDGNAAHDDERVLAFLDARRDEVYCQMFSVAGHDLVPLHDARDTTVEKLANEIHDLPVILTGDAPEKLSHLLGPGKGVRFVPRDLARCSAASVALLGEKLFASGKREDPATLDARYIKEFFFHTLTTR